eukprot:616136-Amorphochlora_amoeboformis.AAC.1
MAVRLGYIIVYSFSIGKTFARDFSPWKNGDRKKAGERKKQRDIMEERQGEGREAWYREGQTEAEGPQHRDYKPPIKT